jgi:hypothetical protein
LISLFTIAEVLVDIVITKNAGKLGVLYWINHYLELEGKESVSEDHPAVGTFLSGWRRNMPKAWMNLFLMRRC